MSRIAKAAGGKQPDFRNPIKPIKRLYDKVNHSHVLDGPGTPGYLPAPRAKPKHKPAPRRGPH